MSLKGARARSQTHKAQLVRQAQTEHLLESLHLPKSAATDRVLDTMHVPHTRHGKTAAKKPNVWWAQNKSKVSLGCLIAAMLAAMTLSFLMQS